MTVPHGAFHKVLDHLQISARDPFIKILGKCFDIDIHGVHIGKQLLEHPKGRRPVGDQDVFHARLVDKPGGIAHKFPADQRFVVGIGHADIARVPVEYGVLRDLLRRQIAHGNRGLGTLIGQGDVMILAK